MRSGAATRGGRSLWFGGDATLFRHVLLWSLTGGVSHTHTHTHDSTLRRRAAPRFTMVRFQLGPQVEGPHAGRSGSRSGSGSSVWVWVKCRALSTGREREVPGVDLVEGSRLGTFPRPAHSGCQYRGLCRLSAFGHPFRLKVLSHGCHHPTVFWLKLRPPMHTKTTQQRVPCTLGECLSPCAFPFRTVNGLRGRAHAPRQEDRGSRSTHMHADNVVEKDVHSIASSPSQSIQIYHLPKQAPAKQSREEPEKAARPQSDPMTKRASLSSHPPTQRPTKRKQEDTEVHAHKGNRQRLLVLFRELHRLSNKHNHPSPAVNYDAANFPGPPGTSNAASTYLPRTADVPGNEGDVHDNEDKVVHPLQ